MNCKPNQRAIVTRTMGVKEAVHYLGMVCTVRKVITVTSWGPLWSIDPGNVHPIDAAPQWCKGDPVKAIDDAMLTPLPDDPGPLIDEGVPQQLEMTQ